MRSRAVTLLLVTWATLVVGSLYAMARYEATPGAVAVADRGSAAPATRPSDKASLLMFVHPKCPCSAASIEELATLASCCGDRVAITVYFFQPSGESADWCHTALWQAAGDIPGVAVAVDPDARRARQCGAQTSGQVLLYSPAGRLLYAGGLTGSRGHVGDNDALDAVEHLLLAPPASNSRLLHAPVFGCAIYATQAGV